jgi:hypothetical protein
MQSSLGLAQAQVWAKVTLDYVPPDEYETAHYAQTQASQPATPQP